MYRLLCSANIDTDYEKEEFVLAEEIKLANVCYERQVNGKGEFKDRSDKTINSIKYTPDFTGIDYIIEVKGWASPRFNVIWRLFKQHLVTIKDNRMLFKPQSLKDFTEVVKLIKQKRLNDKKKRQSTENK